jgi:hypothetical protein
LKIPKQVIILFKDDHAAIGIVANESAAEQVLIQELNPVGAPVTALRPQLWSTTCSSRRDLRFEQAAQPDRLADNHMRAEYGADSIGVAACVDPLGTTLGAGGET